MNNFLKATITLMFAATLASAFSQQKIRDEEVPYVSDIGKFSIVPPRHFLIFRVEEQGKSMSDLVSFAANVSQTVIIKANISMFENAAGLSLEEWADKGRRTWVLIDGYKEEKYEKVKLNGEEAYLHVFTYYLTNAYGKARDRFKVKSIRMMHHNVGYWFFFYATPSKFEEYAKFFDDSLKSLKFTD